MTWPRSNPRSSRNFLFATRSGTTWILRIYSEPLDFLANIWLSCSPKESQSERRISSRKRTFLFSRIWSSTRYNFIYDRVFAQTKLVYIIILDLSTQSFSALNRNFWRKRETMLNKDNPRKIVKYTRDKELSI